jgi:predicted 2-oxoglutarate/Fe(II)-dependent dioxygenase YbiX
MEWYDLPREEKINKRLEDSFVDQNTKAINLEYGIQLYKNAISKEECKKIIDLIEGEVAKNLPKLAWNGAHVNGPAEHGLKGAPVGHARNCYDIKFKKEALGSFYPKTKELETAYDLVDQGLTKCVKHYEKIWNIGISYKEAFNFVKYLPGEYFKIHTDHGPYYTCTLSAVIYLNDDYVGGELDFTRHNITLKPDAGDIILFPSNFVYEHASLNVSSGTKYSVVVMMDYNDRFHSDGIGVNY